MPPPIRGPLNYRRSYKELPTGTPTTHPEPINADLLAFLKTAASVAA
jgi:hypothetical protein